MAMENALREWAEKRGGRIAWAGVMAVHETFGRLARMRDAGLFDPAFFETSLAWALRPETVAALPRPAHLVTFEHGGREQDLVLPPTYHRYTAFFNDTAADLAQFTGGRLALRVLKAPLKTLAVALGVVRYGKNNVTYADGVGSCLQLVGLATDTAIDGGAADVMADFDFESARESFGRLVLERCRNCRICGAACPTQAIGGDRFLLHTERCLTVASENEGPLPPVYAKLKTRCLVGCLVCQEVCPANRGLLKFERLPIRFSPEETAYIAGWSGSRPGPSAELLSGLKDKCRAMDCNEFAVDERGPNPIFRRNLRAVLGVGPQKNVDNK
jgi:epoxyqueuosine reductase